MKPEVEPYFFPLLTYGATLEDYERQEYEFRYELLKEKLLSQQKMNWLRKILGFQPKMTYFDFQCMTQKNLDRMLQKMEDDKWFNYINIQASYQNTNDDIETEFKKTHNVNNIRDVFKTPLRIGYSFLPSCYHVHDAETAKYIGADFKELVELRCKLLRNNGNALSYYN